MKITDAELAAFVALLQRFAPTMTEVERLWVNSLIERMRTTQPAADEADNETEMGVG